MARFKVTKKLTYTYETYVEAKDWEEAEDMARELDDSEWEDVTDYYCDDDIEAEEDDYYEEEVDEYGY